MTPITIETVIVGAGPTGLAISACLRRRGRPHVLLDRAPAVGWSWRNHYERLHLHTAKEYSHLPHFPMPEDYPSYPSRAQVVAYLERYVQALELEPRLGVDVRRASHDGHAWHIETQPGPGYRARHLVVATGYNAVPVRPSWPGLETFAGEILHSSEYRSGEAWRDKDALVVGSGNSGAEIAIDLWEHGARPAMSIRGPVHVVPRDAFGLPSQRLTLALSKLPARLADKLSEPLRDLVIGDLRRYGIERPSVGPLELLETTGRVPLIDIGTVALIKQGAVTVFPGLDHVTGDTVHFVDGRSWRVDLILLATGYRANLGAWLSVPRDLLDDRGLPRTHGREATPGLYFCGFRNPTTGALRESGLEAERVAADISAQARRAPVQLGSIHVRR